MSLLTQAPMAPQATVTARTHELRVGTEVVQRDGTSSFVTDLGVSGRRIFVQLTDGHAKSYRRDRRWRVIAPPAGSPPESRADQRISV